MTVHIVSDELLVLEGSQEELNEEDILSSANCVLAGAGLCGWASAEAEAVCSGDGVLLILRPVRVFIPKFLQILERG